MQISRDVNPPRGRTLTAVRVDPGRVTPSVRGDGVGGWVLLLLLLVVVVLVSDVYNGGLVIVVWWLVLVLVVVMMCVCCCSGGSVVVVIGVCVLVVLGVTGALRGVVLLLCVGGVGRGACSWVSWMYGVQTTIEIDHTVFLAFRAHFMTRFFYVCRILCSLQV